MQQNFSIMSVFDAIASSGEVSRAAISDITGFSLMTVGKAVDKLCLCGVISEKKLTGGGVGRKSGVCALTSGFGMILFDLTKSPRARAVDISNNVICEYAGDNICELMLKAMNALSESGCTEIMGTCAVISRAQREKISAELEEALGFVPELVVEENLAWAYANAKRFEYNGLAMFLRVHSNGIADGALMLADRPYRGANGRAGDFLTLGITRENLAHRLADMCLLADPELIHISCDIEGECSSLEAEIAVEMDKRGFGGHAMAGVVVEPSGICRSALDGAAFMLRQKYLLSKIPNNT